MSSGLMLLHLAMLLSTSCRSHTVSYVQATRGYEDARAKVAKLINARSSREIVFTANATAGINLVAHSWGRKHLEPGDEVRLSVLQFCHMGECFWPSSCVIRNNVLISSRV